MDKSRDRYFISSSLASAIMVLGGFAFTALALHLRGDRRASQYERISAEISELDGLPGTSASDWRIVYSEALGREFDIHRDTPENLSIEDLRTIESYVAERKSGK